MKQQVNFRASDQTRREIAELVEYMGDTQTSIIERAIAELHRQMVCTCPQCGEQVRADEYFRHMQGHSQP